MNGIVWMAQGVTKPSRTRPAPRVPKAKREPAMVEHMRDLALALADANADGLSHVDVMRELGIKRSLAYKIMAHAVDIGLAKVVARPGQCGWVSAIVAV